MSVALNDEGTYEISKKTYSEPVCEHGHARGAQELANWLKSPDRFGRPATYSPEKAKERLKGKSGIVFLMDCFRRDDGTAGDHIDLWDGKKMMSASSDLLAESQKVWFWELD